MATVTQSSVSYLFDEVTSEVAFESFYDMPFLHPALYSVRGSAGRRERASSLGGLGRFNSKAETVDADQATITQQFQKTFTHTAYALQIPVSREVVDDEEWGFLQEIGMELGQSAAQSMEIDAFALFNDAFDGASYTAEDSLSICNGAHLNADSGNSQDNDLANAFSVAGVKATRTNMRKVTNAGGLKVAVNPDELLVPVDIEEDAWEVVRSAGRPDTANRADNMYNGMFTLYVSPFLTDTGNWFMMDSRLRARNLVWYMRTGLEIFGDGNLSAGTKTIGGYYRESHGCKDWRWICGNQA